MIYLDHAATTPVDPAVADEMYAVLKNEFANPSAQYPAGREMAARVKRWRSTVAAALACEAGRLYFTSCGTEGDNWALRAALWQNRHMGRHIVTTAVEHSAILECCRQLEQEGCSVTYVSPDQNGNISAEHVLAAVQSDTALVSVMLVNNELGNVYPVAEIAAGLSAKNPNTLLHTDAVQAFMKLPFGVKTLGADLVTVSAHKIGGPKGIGALYAGPRLKNLRSFLAGGAQESGRRAGTEATAQIAGFAKAVEIRSAHAAENAAHLHELQAVARERFSAIEGVKLFPGGADHILALSLVGWPAQNIVTDLGEQGICVSAGSACHQGKPSHVIAALGLPPKERAGVIRLSFGPETTKDDIDAAARALKVHRDTRFPML